MLIFFFKYKTLCSFLALKYPVFKIFFLIKIILYLKFFFYIIATKISFHKMKTCNIKFRCDESLFDEKSFR